MRVVGTGLVAIAAAAAVYFWSNRQPAVDDTAEPNSAEVSTPATTPAAPTQPDQTSVAGTEPQPQAVDDSEDATAVAEQSTDQPADPFRVVDNDTPDSVSDDTDSPLVETPTAAADQLAEEAVEATTQTSRKVVIPAGGYPVEDSMKYFVPKHERRPGNLGGPPPPAFMVPENADGVRSIESLLPPAPEAPGQ